MSFMEKCILCTDDFEKLTSEHIIPDSLGGIIKIACLCEECNSALGDKVDKLITDSELLLCNRYKYNIEGKKNKLPKIGSGKAIDENGMEMGFELRFKYEEGKFEVIDKLIKKDDESFIIIANDKKEMQKMAEKRIERLNDGSKLDYKSLDNVKEMKVALKEIKMKPNLNKELKFLILPLLKIVFEMSFLVFGDKYLDDDIAEEYRKILYSVAIEDADFYTINKNRFELAFIKGEPKSETQLKFYEEGGKLFLEIILFNIFAKFLVSNNSTKLKITNECKQYLSSVKKLDFLKF